MSILQYYATQNHNILCNKSLSSTNKKKTEWCGEVEKEDVSEVFEILYAIADYNTILLRRDLSVPLQIVLTNSTGLIDQ